MKINGKINKIIENGGLLAECSVSFDEKIVIRKILLVQTKKGDVFVSMPHETYKDKQGETKYFDHAYIMDKDLAEVVTDVLFDLYENYEEPEEAPKKRTTRGK